MAKRTKYVVENYVGTDFVKNHINMSIEESAVEAVINSIMAGAENIQIGAKGREFEIVDNGTGLIGEGEKSNKDGILRPGDSNKKGFGSGVKGIFDKSNEVRLNSIPEDAKDTLLYLSFSDKEFFDSFRPGSDKKKLEYDILDPSDPKVLKEHWPFSPADFRKGLWLKAFLKNPFPRQERFARILAGRLLSKYRDCEIVTLNGSPLPQIKLIGDYWSFKGSYSTLDDIVIECYHPHPDDRIIKPKNMADAFRIGGRGVADAYFEAFLEALDDDVVKTLHPLWRTHSREIGGSLIIPWVEEYANSDRKSFKSENKEGQKLSSDSRLTPTLGFLNYIVEKKNVMERLKITIGKRDGLEDHTRVIKDLFSMINSATGGPIVRTDKETKGGDGSGDDNRPKPPKDEDDALSLTSDRREYEKGELVTLTVHIREDLQNTFSPKDITYYEYSSNCTDGTKTEDGYTLRARYLGEGTVTAEFPKKYRDKYNPARVRFDIKEERIFRITKPARTIQCGENCTIRLTNVDKGTPPFTWDHTGIGILKGNGETAVFTSDKDGEVTVTVTDSSDTPQVSQCRITVTPANDDSGTVEEEILKLEDEHGRIIHFRHDHDWFIEGELSTRGIRSSLPIQMSRSGGDGTLKSPYEIVLHRKASGYEDAEKAGMLDGFLLGKICEEFPKFMRFESKQREEECREEEEAFGYEDAEQETLLAELSEEACRTFSRIITKSNKK